MHKLFFNSGLMKIQKSLATEFNYEGSPCIRMFLRKAHNLITSPAVKWAQY
jgi:hypothetical protein